MLNLKLAAETLNMRLLQRDGYAIDKINKVIREVWNEAIEESAKACERFHVKRVESAKSGAEYPGILLGEASGATHCARDVRGLKHNVHSISQAGDRHE